MYFFLLCLTITCVINTARPSARILPRWPPTLSDDDYKDKTRDLIRRAEGESTFRRLKLEYYTAMMSATCWGRTPLMEAIRHKELDLAQWLVDARVNLHARDSLGYTALHYTIVYQASAITVQLINQLPCLIHMPGHDRKLPLDLVSDSDPARDNLRRHFKETLEAHTCPWFDNGKERPYPLFYTRDKLISKKDL